MKRLYGLVCIRNEADRYLAEALNHQARFLDAVFAYDDCSTDDSAILAGRVPGVTVEKRSRRTPSFLEHEGRFRQASWEAMAGYFQPSPGFDWVLCFDADEFFAARQGKERAALYGLAMAAVESGYQAVDLRIDEIFAEQPPMRRVDGYWGAIHSPRFVRYQRGLAYADKTMGVGSAPTTQGRIFDATDKPYSIHHYGYLRPEDRSAKYERYRRLGGHSPAHVESILHQPTLEAM